MFISYFEACRLIEQAHKILLNSHQVYLIEDTFSCWLETEKGLNFP